MLGALGCVAIFSLGCLLRDRRTGLLAAILLMFDPLYRLHARRAMSDVPAEALILATLALGLWAWRRSLSGRLGVFSGLTSLIGVGLLAGLAVLAKLNGGLAIMTITAWLILASWLERFPMPRRLAVLGITATAAVLALATFILLNPYVLARPTGPLPPWLLAPLPPNQTPIERIRAVIQHRQDVSDQAQSLFPHDALTTPAAKVAAVAVQGFGRFSPLGPRDHDSLKALPRYSWRRDWSALLWLPWVAAGVVWTFGRGRRQLAAAEPPTAWAVLFQAMLAFVTVTAFIPLAWDRYFLSLQPSAILLASGVAVAGLDRLRRRVRAGPSGVEVSSLREP